MSEKRWQDRLSADDYRREEEAERKFNQYAPRRIPIGWVLVGLILLGIFLYRHFFS